MGERATPETPPETEEAPTLSFADFATAQGLDAVTQARFLRWLGLHAYNVRGVYTEAVWQQYYAGARGHIHG